MAILITIPSQHETVEYREMVGMGLVSGAGMKEGVSRVDTPLVYILRLKRYQAVRFVYLIP
jgi:hypothetical protein